MSSRKSVSMMKSLAPLLLLSGIGNNLFCGGNTGQAEYEQNSFCKKGVKNDTNKKKNRKKKKGNFFVHTYS